MFLADLHIHSHYARATSQLLVPEMLALWGRRKGLGVIGTGDFTHPGWRAELREKLIEAEPGLFSLRSSMRAPEEFSMPCGQEPRFVLSCEISSIYKKNGRVRKVHNVLLMPGFAQAEAFSKKLEQIGNLHSDGRPILGLDSHDVLEIALECCPDVLFIPAHIWTPHFSLFGAYSGFDTLEECFGDLSGHIHALETGLSSDPAMNWRLSTLDGYTLVSNSDAHSPANLAREANIFHCELSYDAMRQALCHPESDAYGGTLEFFPEEGKYHMDGHRTCKVCLSPQETNALHGLCPVCGQKLTVGVLHRVNELADRPEGFVPPGAKPYESLIPLSEVIASTLNVGPASRKVQRAYQAALSALGPELFILRTCPLEDIAHACGPLVAESVRRLRLGQVEMAPGYDGAYGKAKILSAEEAAQYSGQLTFLQSTPAAKPAREKKKAAVSAPRPAVEAPSDTPGRPAPQADEFPYGLNQAQWQAAGAQAPAVAVSAGPGTGKTRTLICRIRFLIEQCGVHPSQITAVTFTNKAAREMKQRLAEALPEAKAARAVNIGTFHALCSQLLQKWKQPVCLIDQANARQLMAQCAADLGLKGSPARLLEALSRRKNGLPSRGETPLSDALCEAYQNALAAYGLMDYDDLLVHALEGFTGAHKRDKAALRMFHHLLVDEFQDINPLQYQLVQAWGAKSASVFVIGDPDQAIYGFRGADAHCFDRFAEDHPERLAVHLTENYRSTPEILSSALPIVGRPSSFLHPHAAPGEQVKVLQAHDEFTQGVYVAKQINRLVGGIGMLEAHAGQADTAPRGFGDIAVLYRTHRQSQLLEHCLQTEGIPYTVTGRGSFLDEAEIRAAVSFCRLLLSPGDLLSLRVCLGALSVPPREIAAITDQLAATQRRPDDLCACLQAGGQAAFGDVLSSLLSKAARLKPTAALDHWLALGGPQSSQLSLLRGVAASYAQLVPFLQALSLGLDGDITRIGGKKVTLDAVSLMTLHASKGLEFPVVFLCGVQEGVLPLVPPTGTCDLEEERRLLYVGMTRAKESLTLLSPPVPSPFLNELPDQFVLRGSAGQSRPYAGKQLSLF